MKKITLFLLVLITFISCEEESSISFSEVNFASEEFAIVEMNIPKFGGTTKAANKMNASIDNFITNALAMDSVKVSDFSIQAASKRFDNEYKEFLEKFPDTTQPWEAFVDGEVTYQSSEIVSVAVNTYTNTGSAQGNSFIYFLNFDPANGDLYSYDDVIDRLESLKSLVQEHFKKNIDVSDEEYGYFFDNGFKLPESLGFSEEGIIVLYNNFELGIYDGKMIEFTIPFDEVSDFLNLNF